MLANTVLSAITSWEARIALTRELLLSYVPAHRSRSRRLRRIYSHALDLEQRVAARFICHAVLLEHLCTDFAYERRDGKL